MILSLASEVFSRVYCILTEMAQRDTRDSQTGRHSASTQSEKESNCKYPSELSSTGQLRSKSLISHNIMWSSVILLFPMPLLTTLLLLYIFVNRIKDKAVPLSMFGRTSTIPQDRSYYVDVDSTKLIVLASWSSSVAPFLIGSAVALTRFPVAKRLLRDCLDGQVAQLPDSQQLQLILRLTSGSTWETLFDTFKFCIGRGSKKTRCGIALSTLTAVVLSMTVLSGFVVGFDTYLHIVTKTVALMQYDNLSANDAMYGFTAAPSCLATNNTYAAAQSSDFSCTLESSRSTFALDNPEAVAQTINNRSSETAILQMANSNLSYISVPPDYINVTHDFIASTYGIEGSCVSTSQSCHLNDNGNVTFNCSDGAFDAEGDIFNNVGIAIQFFKYRNLSDVRDSNVLAQKYGVFNPFYLVGAISGQVPQGSNLTTDPDVVVVNDRLTGIFECQFRVVDLDYAWIQGQGRIVNIVPSNNSITNMFVAPMTRSAFWQNEARSAMWLAGFEAEDATELGNYFRMSMSNALLSGGAGSVQRSPAHTAQARKEILATKVPLLPLYLLVGSNLLFVGLGLLLTIVAVRTPHNVRAAQYYLTVAGIVSQLFESDRAWSPTKNTRPSFAQVDDSTASSLRIGIDRNSRGDFGLRGVPLEYPLPSGLEEAETEQLEVRRSRIFSLLSLRSFGPEELYTEADRARFARNSYFWEV